MTITNQTLDVLSLEMEVAVSDYMYIAYIILGLSSCSANATLIWIIIRKKSFHTISNILVVSLASSDFMLGIVVSPMEMVHHLLPEFIMEGYGCLAHQVLMIFVPVVSICHLLLVAVERFVKIVFPLHYHSIATRFRTAVLIVLAWTAPFVLSMMPFMGLHANMEPNSTNTGCATLNRLLCPYLYSVVALICIICIIMAILYSKIIKIALHHAKQIRCTSVPRLSNVKVWRLAELRALTVLLMTVLYFILSWTPFSVSVIDECVANITPDYSTTAVFIAYFNSTVNPIMYGIGNKELRNSFLGMCWRRKENRVVPVVTGLTNITLHQINMTETKV